MVDQNTHSYHLNRPSSSLNRILHNPLQLKTEFNVTSQLKLDGTRTANVENGLTPHHQDTHALHRCVGRWRR